MTEIIIGLGALDRRLAAIHSDAAKREYMGQLALMAVREAKFTVARKTGNTGRTIAIAEVTADHATVEAGGAAQFLEFDTRPHLITARRAKALRFAATAGGRKLTGSPRKGAKVVFRRSVHHPGTKAQPFLRPAAEAAIERFSEATEALIRRWNAAA